jgi:hypothetical protein
MADLLGNPEDDGEQAKTESRSPTKFRVLVRPKDTTLWTPPLESVFVLLDAEVEGQSQDQAR